MRRLPFYATFRNYFEWIRGEFSDDSVQLTLCFLNLFALLSFYEWSFDPFFLERVSTTSLTNLSFVPAPWMRSWADYLLFPESIVKRFLHFLCILTLFTFYFFKKRRVATAVSISVFLFFSKFVLYNLAFLNFEVNGHFHLFYLFIILFLPEKKKALVAGLVLTYLTSGLAKLNASWLSGEFFQSSAYGLILLPKNQFAVTTFSWLVILIELFGVWYLNSKKDSLQRGVASLFLLFHIYSTLHVGAKFPFLMIGFLLCLFKIGKMRFDWKMSFANRAIFVSFFFSVFLISQWHLFIPGSRALTSEMKYAGPFMYAAVTRCRLEVAIQTREKVFNFEQANSFDKFNQRRAKLSITDRSSGLTEEKILSGHVYKWDGKVIYNLDNISHNTGPHSGRICADPYVLFSYIKLLRASIVPEKVSLKIFRSLNGYEDWFPLVSVDDFDPDKLTYSFWTHNRWINLPGPDHPSIYTEF